MKKALLFLSVGLIGFSSFAQMSGNKTINPSQAASSTNFQSWATALSALQAQGVNGPVTFWVKQGTYTGQITMPTSIAGTSTTNTITFRSDSTNTQNPVMTNGSYVLYFYNNNLNNIKFKDLNFVGTSSYCVYIYEYNSTSYVLKNITFEDCLIETPLYSTGFYPVYSYCYYSGDHNIIYDGCTIKGGYYGMYNYLYYCSAGASVTVQNSQVIDWNYMGFYNYAYNGVQTSQGKFVIKNNVIKNHTSGTACYPMYNYYYGPGSEVSGNYIEINASSAVYGVLMYYAYGTSAAPVKVHNNIVNYPTASASYQRGLMFGYGYYNKIYHNTVKLSMDNTNNYGAYLYYSSTSYVGNEFKNNMINSGTGTAGYAVYTYKMPGTGYLDFSNNSYFGNNGDQARFYNAYTGTNTTSLSAWQSAISSDANSVVTDPLYTSSTNLTPQSASSNNIGTPVGITIDYNGATRSATTPDPGAIEYSVPTNNAQPTVLLNPKAPLCDDDTSVVIILKNTGLVNLTSVNINYSLNNGTPTVVAWSDTLAPQGTDTVTVVASTSFSNGNNVRVWTSLPNGVQDSAAMFDTLEVDLFDGLSGTYSIPGDYATLNAAKNALVASGVCGHVVFEIATGTYTEQVSFPTIPGTSEDATVTFRSAAGNYSAVKLQYAATGQSDNYVIRMDGADWMRFEDLSIFSTGTNLYGVLVAMQNGAHNNTVEDCWLKTNPYGYTGTGNYMSNVYIMGINNYNRIIGNRIEKGNTPIYAYGSSATARIIGLVVEDNIIEDYWYYGPYFYFHQDFEFNRNVVKNDSVGYSPYVYMGMYLYDINRFNFTNNYIHFDPVATYYTLYMYNCIGANNPRAKFMNNCIISGGPSTTYTYYNLYMSGCGNMDFYNNSITRRGISGQYNAYITSGGAINMMNNSFADMNNGYAAYIVGGFTVQMSDYNNFYSGSSNPIYFGSQAFSSLTAYQTATGNDMHSVRTNPDWQVANECITCNDTLNNAGMPLSVNPTDITGNTRSSNTPDIGPVEYLTPSSFTLGPDSTYCGDEITIEAGPAQSISWLVNNVASSTPTITLTASGAPETFSVFVNIVTEYCGSASDDAEITLVPNANLDSALHLCAAATETLSPGGGSSATYTWSTGENTSTIVVAEPGVYSVTKDELGCESSTSISVTQSAAVDILDVEECSDNMPVSLDATIVDGTSYAWSGGNSINTDTNSFNSGGTYSVTATDLHGCASSDNFTISVLEEPVAVITENHSGVVYNFDGGNSLFLGSNPTYFWDFGYNNQTATTQTATVFYPWAGNNNTVSYTVTLTVTTDCGENITTMDVTPDPLAVNEIGNGTFTLYPNPANDLVQFTLANAVSDQGLVQVLDLSGRIVLSQALNSGSKNSTINVSDLAQGSYLVKVTVDGTVSVNSLVKQ